MTGRVDDEGHAVLALVITNPVTGASVHLDTWVDTGFTGGLLLPPAVIASLGLQRSSAVSAELADGTHVVFHTHTCLVAWFGCQQQIETLAGAGPVALLGVGLINECVLTVDYPGKTVRLTLPSNGVAAQP